MLEKSSKINLSAAQKRLLGRIAHEQTPIIAVGERRYEIDGEHVHYRVVEALESKGFLVRSDNRLVLAEPYAEFANGTKTVQDGNPKPTAPTTDPAPRDLAVPARALPAHEKPSETQTALSDLLVDDDPPDNDALMRRNEDDGKHDAGALARNALRRSEPSSRRDDSLLGWLWRRLDGWLGS